MSRTLQPRHTWACTRMSQCLDVSLEEAQRFLKQQKNYATFQLLCSAQPHSPTKLYVFYQAPEEQNEEGELVQTSSDPVLFFGSGEEEAKLCGPACFFRRTSSNSIDLTKHSDASLIFGSVDEAPLRGLQLALTGLIQPMLDVTKPWGKADADFVADFRSEMGAMVQSLHEARRSLVDRIELKRPERRFLVKGGGDGDSDGEERPEQHGDRGAKGSAGRP